MSFWKNVASTVTKVVTAPIVIPTKAVIDMVKNPSINPITAPIQNVKDFIANPSLSGAGAIVLSTNLQTASLNAAGKETLVQGVNEGIISQPQSDVVTNFVNEAAAVITGGVATVAAGMNVSDLMKGNTPDGSVVGDTAGSISPDTASIFSNKWFWIIGGGVGMVFVIMKNRGKI